MRMDRVGLALVFAATTVISACADTQAQTANRTIKKGGDDRTGDYVPAPEGWWKDAPNHDETYTWGQASGVVADARGSLRLQRVLVVAQIAFSLLLATAAGLFGRTVYNLLRTDAGFRMERLVQFS